VETYGDKNWIYVGICLSLPLQTKQTLLMLTYDIKKSAPNTVVVEVGATMDDTVEYGNLKLHIDPEFNPTHYARIYGRVIAVPDGKAYNEEGVEIGKNVQVGDIIYFHYLTTSDETNCIYGNYYKVPYYWVFCIVRSGNILPVGSWTLCETVVEEEFNHVEVDGQKIEAITSASGLVIGINKKPSTKFARLVYIGAPVGEGIEIDVSPGELVLLNKNSNFVNKIEGKEYYTVRQSDILSSKL
jgi:co-chaperonin GroES (HSP10)